MIKKTLLCKFCDKPLDWKFSDRDKYYFCKCDGQKHFDDLKTEIIKLKNQLYNKEQELKIFENQNLFNTKLNKLESQIYKLKDGYEDSHYRKE